MPRDYYITLGVQRDASAEEVLEAYRDLARKYHPDLNPNDPRAEKRFQEVQAAFEVLSDSERRAAYDCTELSFTTAGGSASGLGGGVDDTQLAGRVFAAVRRQSDSRPYRFDSHGSLYVSAMVDATIAWLLVIGVGALLVVIALSTRTGLGDLSSEEISLYAEQASWFRFWGRSLCFGATLVYGIVMLVLLREHFSR